MPAPVQVSDSDAGAQVAFAKRIGNADSLGPPVGSRTISTQIPPHPVVTTLRLLRVIDSED